MIPVHLYLSLFHIRWKYYWFLLSILPLMIFFVIVVPSSLSLFFSFWILGVFIACVALYIDWITFSLDCSISLSCHPFNFFIRFVITFAFTIVSSFRILHFLIVFHTFFRRPIKVVVIVFYPIFLIPSLPQFKILPNFLFPLPILLSLHRWPVFDSWCVWLTSSM